MKSVALPWRLVAPDIGGWSLGRVALTLGVLCVLGWTALALGEMQALLHTTTAIFARTDLLAVFVISYTAAFGLRAVAWWVLLQPDQRPCIWRLFTYLQVALLANHVFPTKVGEVARIGLLARRGTTLAVASGSTALARLIDLACLCLLAVLGVALLGNGARGLLPQLALPALLVVFGAGVLLALPHARSGWLTRLVPPRIERMVLSMRDAMTRLTVRRLIAAFALTLPSWLLESLAVWTVARAAGIEIGLGVAIAATAFTIAFQGFQVTPGGIGLYEASLTTALSLSGVDPAMALATAVGTHALKFVYAYAVGLVCLPLAVGIGFPVAVPRGRVPEAAVCMLVALAATLLLAPNAAAGVLVILPILVLIHCHHLPRALWPLLLVPAGVFVPVFGIPRADVIALSLAISAVLACLRQAPLSALLWTPLVSQLIVVGAARPLEGLVFGTSSLVGLVLARQWWLARRSLPAPAAVPHGATVAIVVPVHDERTTIESVIGRIPREELARRGFGTRVIVVDDGSTDGSGKLALRAGADEVVVHPRRRGLGAALRAGLRAARDAGCAAAVYLDADAEYDPREVPAVLEPVVAGQADYVLGTRFPTAGCSVRLSRRWGNRAFTLLLCVLSGRRVTDGQTGFRAFGPRALAAAEIIHDYNYAQVLTLDLLRKRLRFAEVPISYEPRRGGRSFVRYPEYVGRVLPAIAREVLGP